MVDVLKAKERNECLPMNDQLNASFLPLVNYVVNFVVSSHTPFKCPAMHVHCNKCKFKGHFGKKCLSKTVADITEGVMLGQDEGEDEDALRLILELK